MPRHAPLGPARAHAVDPLPKLLPDFRALGPGMYWKGGEVPPPPLLQGAQPMPSRCPPDARCRLERHL